jgi:hypothetical protein
MIERLHPELLTALRKRFLEGPEADLPLHCGYYLIWYAAVEFQITTMLAIVLDFPRWERLHHLIRGMDARIKCARLREAAAEFRPLGENLAARLTFFENHCIPLRNKLAHSTPIFDSKSRIVHFTNTRYMPVPVDGDLNREWQSDAPQIHLDDFFSQACWLNLFATDLTAAVNSLIDGGLPEIISPKSNLPQEVHPPSRHKDAPAKSNRRTRKRAQKQQKLPS